MTDKNALYVAKWYYKQKNEGIIYKLTVGPETYVGSTKNSLKKRLWQHKSGVVATVKEAYAVHGVMEIEELEVLVKGEDIRQKEQEWIDRLKPSLNMNGALRKERQLKRCYKGGVEYLGVWYPTRKRLWETLGKVPYNTFKVRLHKRPEDFSYALGN